MKKELDHRINSESMYNLSNLAFSIRGNYTLSFTPLNLPHFNTLLPLGITDDPNVGSEGDDDLPRLPSNANSTSNVDLASESGKQVDLFSEIHLNELKKLEKQLEQVII